MIQYTVYRVEDTGYMSQYTLHRYRIQITGFSTHDTGYKIQYRGYRIQYTVYRIQYTVHRVKQVRCKTYFVFPGDPV